MSVPFFPLTGVALNIAYVIGTTVGFYLLGKIISPVVRWTLEARSHTLAKVVSRLSHYATVVVGIGIGLTAGGYGNVLTAFGTIVAAGTIALGFAMQDTIGAAVAGLFLLIDRPFEVGDWIEWNGRAGIVKDIHIRTTEVTTFDNEQLTVPNNELANTTVKNPVAGDKLRVQLPIGIGYDDDIEKAKEIVQDILEQEEAIADDPAPGVKVVGLGDSTIDMKARYWLLDPKRADFVGTRERVLAAVKRRFAEEDIDIPYPTTTIAGDSISLEGDM